MMTNIKRFKHLKVLEQLDAICDIGVVVAEKRQGIYQYDLFQISDFYVEVYENLASHKLEKVEPVKDIRFLRVYENL